MPPLPPQAEESLKQTHAKGAELLQANGHQVEPFEVARLVEQHRWYWRPRKVNLLLVAESHVFTPPHEADLVIDNSMLQPDGLLMGLNPQAGSSTRNGNADWLSPSGVRAQGGIRPPTMS